MVIDPNVIYLPSRKTKRNRAFMQSKLLHLKILSLSVSSVECCSNIFPICPYVKLGKHIGLRTFQSISRFFILSVPGGAHAHFICVNYETNLPDIIISLKKKKVLRKVSPLKKLNYLPHKTCKQMCFQRYNKVK